MPAKKTLRTCKNGHQYYKSTDCPTCPFCEAGRKPRDGFLSLLSAPARRALESEKLTSLKKLSQTTQKEILAMHGIGPGSIPTLKKALRDAGLDFKKEGAAKKQISQKQKAKHLLSKTG